MENSIKILHLEDNPNDSLLVQTILKKPNVNFEYFFADNEDEFISILKNQNIDLILSDYHLPDYTGMEALQFAKSNFPEIPFVFLSGIMGEDAAIESLLNGATDYVLKNNMERLLTAVQRALNGAKEQKAKRKAENQIRKLSRAIEQSPHSIVITDTNYIIEYANPSVFKLTGYSKEEVIGRPAKLFDAGIPDNIYRNIIEAISSGKEWQGELPNKKKNGELYWTLAKISPIFNDDGVIINFLAIIEDISERKKLTSELLKAKEKAEESDRLKTAFLNNISHEIRTPFNGLLGFLSIIQDIDTTSSERDQYIGIINQSAERLMNTINGIVEISQIQTAQAQLTISETNISELTDKLYTSFYPEASKKKIKLIINNGLSKTTDSVFTDSQKLKSILSNLLSNAIKFTKAGTIELSIQYNEDRLKFSVKDTGVGIPENKQQTIFERFMQVDVSDTRLFEGAGLGLSISKAYVEMLGGKIWVESEIDKGSIFYFTIPYIIEQKEIHDIKIPAPSKEEVSLKKQKILIVEDDDLSEMLITNIVRDHFEKKLYAKTGSEAIEICRNNSDIDLILMDIKMPVMDGYEATRQIRTFNKEIIIIAQTAYSMPGDREKALEAGCNDYISKPYKRALMMKVINKWRE